MKVFALTSTIPGKTLDMLEDMDVSAAAVAERLVARLSQAKQDGWSDIREYRLVSKSDDTGLYHQWNTIEVFYWSEDKKMFKRKS